MKILIPTLLEREQLAPMIEQVERFYARYPLEIFASCLNASAAVNRNACLDRLDVGETAIMLDDDVSGFYSGWVSDLLYGLTVFPNAVMVSARLIRTCGKFAPTCSRCYDPVPEEIEVEPGSNCILPTAAIAFVHRGHRFDENFRGSGFEDGDWCFQYLQADPSAVFVQSNRCRLVHRNDMKNQRGDNWRHNKAYFLEKWGECSQPI